MVLDGPPLKMDHGCTCSLSRADAHFSVWLGAPEVSGIRKYRSSGVILLIDHAQCEAGHPPPPFTAAGGYLPLCDARQPSTCRKIMSQLYPLPVSNKADHATSGSSTLRSRRGVTRERGALSDPGTILL